MEEGRGGEEKRGPNSCFPEPLSKKPTSPSSNLLPQGTRQPHQGGTTILLLLRGECWARDLTLHNKKKLWINFIEDMSQHSQKPYLPLLEDRLEQDLGNHNPYFVYFQLQLSFKTLLRESIQSTLNKIFIELETHRKATAIERKIHASFLLCSHEKTVLAYQMCL